MALDLDLVERRIESGEPVAVVAGDLGVTARTIRNHLHRAGRPLARQLQNDRRRERLSDPEWLRSRYVTDQQPACEIAAELRATTGEVNTALLSLGIVRPPRRPGLTREALLAAFAAGETVSSIARRERIDRHGVRRAMRHHGVVNPHRAAQPRPVMLDDPLWLSDLYEDRGWSLASIARECGSSGKTVKCALERHGIAFRTRPVHPPGGLDAEWLEKQYVRAHRNAVDIAADAGVSVGTLYRALEHHGIRRSSRRKGEAALEDPAWLRERYLHDRATIAEIAAELRVPPKWVRSALRRHGIARAAQ